MACPFSSALQFLGEVGTKHSPQGSKNPLCKGSSTPAPVYLSTPYIFGRLHQPLRLAARGTYVGPYLSSYIPLSYTFTILVF